MKTSRKIKITCANLMLWTEYGTQFKDCKGGHMNETTGNCPKGTCPFYKKSNSGKGV